MKVLMLAEHCNPEWPSLPVVGYKYAKALADRVDLTVATSIRNEPYISRHGFGRAKVVYIDTERIAKPLFKLGLKLRGGMNTGWTLQMAMDYPSYLYFEWLTNRRFGAELATGAFDIVHRSTPMSPTLPSPMASWSPVPFVLGPLNGNLPWPRQFSAEMKREREWMSRFRNVARLLPYYRSTYRNAAAILAAFSHTMNDMATAAMDKVINFPEVGIDPELFSPKKRSASERMTILFAGRLVPYKLPEVAVRIFVANPDLRKHRLLIAGDGPERERLQALIADHSLEECVQLIGQKTQAEVGQLMQSADIFAFPSIRELGAGVVVEAMACGLACVVVDYGGPGTLIDKERGVKVPMGTIDQLVTRFATEIGALTKDPPRVERLGKEAYRHVMAHYAWAAKVDKTLEVYQWVLGQRSEKPDFWQVATDVSGERDVATRTAGN
jgi:glycosyltransferase involved in cell wall biosynthesis